MHSANPDAPSSLRKADSSAIASQKTPSLVLVGNPNVGKSLVFNYLSGLYAEVSNFPGTTVALSKGKYKEFDVIDSPGIYGISSFNDEEKVARDAVINADVVLNVVNALHLERDLFLTVQLLDMQKRMVLVLNFSDELEKRKISIDIQKLSQLLGVEVILTSAVEETGLDKIHDAIRNAKEGIPTPEIRGL